MTEKEIQNDIIRHLSARADLRLFRQQVGVAVPISQCCPQCRRYAIRFGVPGMADLIGIQGPQGRYIAVEVKSPTGRQSEEQKTFQTVVTSLGGLYVVARGIDDVQPLLIGKK